METNNISCKGKMTKLKNNITRQNTPSNYHSSISHRIYLHNTFHHKTSHGFLMRTQPK
ncbi:hypothetical protein Hanom_Chr11g00987751 [Helianthus anomalus]